MPRFVRKNELLFSGSFAAVNGDPTIQPSAATLVLGYTNTLGQTARTTIVMSQTLGIWSCTWDTSDCRDGRVDWMIYSTGPLVAASQGSFDIYANTANTG